MDTTIIIVGLIGLIAGYFLRRLIAKFQKESAEEKAKKITNQAQEKSKEIIFQAKEKALEIEENTKKEEVERQKDLREAEKQFSQRQSVFERKVINLENQENQLKKEKQVLESAKEENNQIHQEAIKTLQKVAGLTIEQAKEKLFASLEQKYKDDILARIRKLEQFGSEQIEKKAGEMIADAMARLTEPLVRQISSTSVSIPSDEIKGRIIGRCWWHLYIRQGA